MERIAEFVGRYRFDSPLYLCLGSGMVLLLILLLRSFDRKGGLAIDLQFWKTGVRVGRRKVLLLLFPAGIASLLVILGLADPQTITRQKVPIFGRPVLAVIDISGSMDFRVEGENLSDFEKARKVFDEIVGGEPEADFGLLLYSTESYIARYFTSKRELLKDTLENNQEISFISTGTQTPAALAKARRFLAEQIEGREKAIILISDLEGSFDSLLETAEEMEQSLQAGIKVYVVLIREGKRKGVYWGPRQSQIREVKVVGMNDNEGMNLIRKEIATMERCVIGTEEISRKKSLIPFLAPPILGLVGLCLILSETRFRRIP